MKEGWKYKKLGDICDKYNGLWKGKKEPFVNVGVIRNANFTKDFTLDFSNIEYLDVEKKQYQSRKLQKGDLIIEKSGGSEKQPVGRAVLFLKEDGEFSFSNFTSVLRIKNSSEILYSFLYRYLLFIYKRGDTAKMQRAATGIHNIEFEKYLSIDVPIPSIDEQQRIVTFLDTEFAKIDALKAKAEQSLQNAKDLFQAALKEEMTPKKGWEEKNMSDLCTINSKLIDPKEEKYQNLLHVGGANIVSKSGELIDLQTAKQEKLESGKFYFEKDAVLYNKIRPYLIKVARPDFSGLCSADMYPLTPSSIMSKDYLYYILISENFTMYAVAGSARAGMPKVNRDHLFAYRCKVPPLFVQQRIVTKLDTLRSHLTKLEQKYVKIATECDALKQVILRKTFE